MNSELNDCNRDDSRRRLFDDRGEVPMPKDVTLSIDDVSKAFRVSKLRLWYYERLGLIKRRNRFGLGFVYQWATAPGCFSSSRRAMSDCPHFDWRL